MPILFYQWNYCVLHFEQKVGGIMSSTPSVLGATAPTVTVPKARSAFLRVNPQKATGPGVSNHICRTFASQLAEVCKEIFNHCEVYSEIPILEHHYRPGANEKRDTMPYWPPSNGTTIMKCFMRWCTITPASHTVLIHYSSPTVIADPWQTPSPWPHTRLWKIQSNKT